MNPSEKKNKRATTKCVKPSFSFSSNNFQKPGMHYAMGIAICTFVVLIMYFWYSRGNYPITLTYGYLGIITIIVELVVLVKATARREARLRHLLTERSWALTFGAGILGGVLVYGIPWAVSQFTQSPWSEWVATLIPLCIYPLYAPTFLFAATGN